MELREVRSFIALAERLNFGEAAKALHLSQPALTKQIHRLEEELGCRLFDRGRHGARLTGTGKVFLKGAQRVVRDCDDLISTTRSAARGETGSLRIGFGLHTLDLVPRAIVRLREAVPEVQIRLQDMSTLEQIEGLRAEKIDIGFIRAPEQTEFAMMPVIEDRLMIGSSAALRLPRKLDIAALKDQPFVTISRERSPTFHEHVLRYCAVHGFHPRIVQEVPEVTTALALARAGLGLAFISQAFGATQFPGVQYHLLRDAAAHWHVSAAWRKGDDNPILHRFLDLIRKESRIARKSPRPARS